MFTPLDFILAALGALGAGLVNALAGGGTLISFPMLVFVGVPALAANVTNTVALSPGYLGATLAQAKDLRGQRSRLWFVAPAGVAGGILGGLLLLSTGERLFQNLVPILILAACALLAVQDPVRAWLVKRAGAQQGAGARAGSEAWVALPVGLAAIYGGYFGAGLSVIVLAVLGLVLNDNLTRLNALKQAVAFSTNVAAAIYFVFSGQVVWSLAAVMAVGALLGGALGGRLAGRIKPATLRGVVVVIGVVVAGIYWLR
jgi:uncharacterized membrane protein YfcA